MILQQFFKRVARRTSLTLEENKKTLAQPTANDVIHTEHEKVQAYLAKYWPVQPTPASQEEWAEKARQLCGSQADYDKVMKVHSRHDHIYKGMALLQANKEVVAKRASTIQLRRSI